MDCTHLQTNRFGELSESVNYLCLGILHFLAICITGIIEPGGNQIEYLTTRFETNRNTNKIWFVL